jgi:magnesium chelatase family protein
MSCVQTLLGTQVTKDRLAVTVFIGELSLDGRLRPVPCVLPFNAAATAAGFERAVVPVENAAEAGLVPECRSGLRLRPTAPP